MKDDLKDYYNSVLTEMDFHLPLYLASTGYWMNQPKLIREKGYKRFQWIQCYEGEGVLEIEGKTIPVCKGQGMLLYPDIPHSYQPLVEPWALRWIDFSGKLADMTLKSLQFHESTVLYVTNPGPLLARTEEIVTAFRNKNSFSSYENSHLLYGLLLDIFRYTSITENRTNYQRYEQLKPVLQDIEHRYSEPITLNELADQLGVTPEYTCVLFQQTLGTRPFEYVNRYRIRKAKELLLQTGTDVKAIGTQVGFASPSYFIKLFKKNEGITPAAFRSMHQNK